MASTHPDPDVQAPADALPKHHALHDWLPSANDLLTKEAAEQLRMQESRPPGTEEEARRSGWGIVEQIRDLIFFAVSDAQKLKVKMLNSRIMNCDDHVREKLGLVQAPPIFKKEQSGGPSLKEVALDECQSLLVHRSSQGWTVDVLDDNGTEISTEEVGDKACRCRCRMV